MSLGRTATTLLGRSAELETVIRSLEGARAGSGRTILVEGEAGIGKTRLVGDAISSPAAHGFQVYEATCDALARSRPFGTLAQALGVMDDAEDPDRASIAALLKDDDQDASAGSTPAVQFRVVEALGGVVERLASTTPVILLLDDLHWADASTLVALRSIARRIDRLPVVVVGTSRPGHDVAELHRVTEEILRAGGTRLVLGPLDAGSVAELVAEIIDAAPSATLLDRVQGAAGNPLFIMEYARALQDEGLIEVRDGIAHIRGSALPVEFRLTVLRRIGQLPEPAIHALRMASVLGSIFSPSDLAIVMARPATDLAQALQAAVDAGVVAEREEQLAFVHDLVRDAVYENIPPAMRKQLHREFGRALATAGVRPLTVAHHLALGADDRDPEAVEWLRRAAHDVVTRAPGVAVELLERARDLLGHASPERDALLAELVMPLAWSGRLAEAETLARQVLERHQPPSIAGALRCGLVYAAAWQGRPAQALEYAVARPEEQLIEPDATLLRAHAAVARMFSFDLPGAAADADEAVHTATRLGNDVALCTALGVQAFLASFSGETAHGIDRGLRAVAVADRSESGGAHLANPRFFLALPLIAADRLAEAEEVLQTGRRIAEEWGHAWALSLYHAYLGTRRFVAGEWDDAIAEFEASIDIAEEVGMTMSAVVAASSWLAVIHVHRDEVEAAEEVLARAQRRVAEHGPQLGMSILAWASALVLEARGNATKGLAMLQGAWDFAVAAGLQAEPWSGAALVRMYSRAGHPERAASLVPIIEAQARIGTPFMKGRALACRGLAESDPNLLVRAVAEYRGCPRPHELALACEDAGIHLGAADRSAEAIPLLEEAISLYEPLRAIRDVSRVRAALRNLGVTHRERRQPVRATTGWGSLTRSEIKVTALIAQRLSNPEIADRLFISRYTVESHLKHIYAKLGLSSRVELAAEAARQDAQRVSEGRFEP